MAVEHPQQSAAGSGDIDPLRDGLRVGSLEVGYQTGFWIVAGAFLLVSALSTFPNPLYGLYQHRDGFSSFTVTLIYAAYAVGIVVSLFFVAHLSDWYGRQRLLLPALGLAGLSAITFLTWRSLPGLFVGRLLCGLALGTVTPTATAYLGELHAIARPQASERLAQTVALVANIGGLGFGALVAGLLARYVAYPLTVPYAAGLFALVLAVIGVALTPETRARMHPAPQYRPQRVSVPREAQGRYFAACLGAAVAFAAGGLFSGLAGTFLSSVLHRDSTALAGITIFAAFAFGTGTQLLVASWPARRALILGIPFLLAGLTIMVIAAWLSAPSLALFLAAAAVTGTGMGAVIRATLGIVFAISPPERRAETVSGFFLAGYIALSLPVIGVGIALQHVSLRTALLGFAIALAAIIVASTRTLMSHSPTEPAGHS